MSYVRFIGGSFVLPKTHASERPSPISDDLLYGLQQNKTQKTGKEECHAIGFSKRRWQTL